MTNFDNFKEEAVNGVTFECPARPFHWWLSFRGRDWPRIPADEIGFPVLGRDNLPAVIGTMMGGYFNYVQYTYGRSPEDYEVWFVDRVDKSFFKIKNIDEAVPILGVRNAYTVPGWVDVPADWPARKLFNLPFGHESPGVQVCSAEEHAAREAFKRDWSDGKWPGGPINIT
ncbi:MAG: hypothetical protein LBQ12_06810 [Deltaproteobacteria bacterium]|jgi:hypothetical protein|nr:hypothetical protein [Deltaproteobacteria bacterium]